MAIVRALCCWSAAQPDPGPEPLHFHIHAKGVSSGSFSAINLESKFRLNLDLVESSTPRGVSSHFVVHSPSK